MASGILFVIVVAVASAITAGQQHSFEAQQRIAATLAAEDLMGRLIETPYAQLTTWNGYTEPVGTMTNAVGTPLPDGYGLIGRDVQVVPLMETIALPSVRVAGQQVTVRAFNAENRTLAQLVHFIPEPMP